MNAKIVLGKEVNSEEKKGHTLLDTLLCTVAVTTGGGAKNYLMVMDMFLYQAAAT